MTALLTHPHVEVIAKLLVDLGEGTQRDTNSSGAWPIFIGTIPDSPDSCIVINRTTSRIGGWFQTGDADEHFGFQILVRALGSSAAEAKVDSIIGKFDRTVNCTTVTISSSSYCVYAITREGDAIPLGTEEESERYLFSLNAVVALRQTV
jgi:hypothetical protein